MKIDEIQVDRKFKNRLPNPTQGEFDALVESISVHGVVVPLGVTQDGLLIDGHRRLDAAKKCGLKTVPVTRFPVQDQGGWEKTMAVLLNLHRRHLNAAWRATLGSTLLRIERKEAKKRQRRGKGAGDSGGRGRKKPQGNSAPKVSPDDGKATERVAKTTGVSRKTVERVEKVSKKDKKLADRMLDGKISVAGAAKKVEVAEIKARAEQESAGSSPGLVTDLSAVFGKYRTIYADPPWSYDDSGTRGAAAGHYPPMTIEELEALQVGKLAHKDGCHLWLWTTWPKIRDEYPHRVFKAWGFDWQGQVVWPKPGMAQGHYIRNDSEILCLGIYRKLKTLRDDLRGVVSAPKGRHSEKPEKYRKYVESASPGPRIELFARAPAKGWDRHGYEA